MLFPQAFKEHWLPFGQVITTYVPKDGWLHWYSEAVSTQCPFGDEMDFKKSYENYQHQSSSINKTCSFHSNFLCGPASSSRAIPAVLSMECIMIHNDNHKERSIYFLNETFSRTEIYFCVNSDFTEHVLWWALYKASLGWMKKYPQCNFHLKMLQMLVFVSQELCLSHIGVAQECYIFLGTETFSLYGFRVVFSNVETVIWGD